MSALSTGTVGGWWRRLVLRHQGPYGLDDGWAVVPGPTASTEFAVGPPGVFLLDHRHVRAAETARTARGCGARLTALLGTCIMVTPVQVDHGGIVRTHQPEAATVVSEIVLGDWLISHPAAHDVRTLARLRHAVGTRG